MRRFRFFMMRNSLAAEKNVMTRIEANILMRNYLQKSNSIRMNLSMGRLTKELRNWTSDVWRLCTIELTNDFELYCLIYMYLILFLFCSCGRRPYEIKLNFQCEKYIVVNAFSVLSLEIRKRLVAILLSQIIPFII